MVSSVPKTSILFYNLLWREPETSPLPSLKIEDFHDNTSIPNIKLPHLESLDSLNNLPFSKLINMQCDSAMESLQIQGNIPLDSISIPRVNEHNIGSLIYYYELLTSFVGELINVNTYDQPGVEAGKMILKKKLSLLKK